MQTFDDFIQRFGQGPPDNREFVEINLSLLVSLMSIGTLIGALSGAYTAEWWGRRRSLTFGVILFIFGNILQITAMNHWAHMTVGRFVAGLGVGNLSVGVPMFQSECLPRQIRGPIVASYQLMITIGKKLLYKTTKRSPLTLCLCCRYPRVKLDQLRRPRDPRIRCFLENCYRPRHLFQSAAWYWYSVLSRISQVAGR